MDRNDLIEMLAGFRNLPIYIDFDQESAPRLLNHISVDREGERIVIVIHTGISCAECQEIERALDED